MKGQIIEVQEEDGSWLCLGTCIDIFSAPQSEHDRSVLLLLKRADTDEPLRFLWTTETIRIARGPFLA